MGQKRYTAEDIIGHLRTIEIETGKGLAVIDACRTVGITEQTYYRWKKEYGGLRVDQAKRVKGLAVPRELLPWSLWLGRILGIKNHLDPTVQWPEPSVPCI